MKKVLSLVLVIAMVLSSMSFAFAAKFEDTADTDYEKAIDTLVALGVINGYDDGTYKPERVVTRAEMAKLIVEILGYGDLVAGSKSNFTDTQGHWADAYIALAAGKGIVVGTGEGKFTPDRTVSYDEAITMIVRALGYTDGCNELKNMTWPTNFKVKAAELKLTKDVELNSTGADRGGVAQLLYNALEATLVTVDSDGNVIKTIDSAKDEVPLLSRLAKYEKTYEVTSAKVDPKNKEFAGELVDLSPYMFQDLKVYLNDDDQVVYVKGTNSLVVEGKIDSVTTSSGKVNVAIENAQGKIEKAVFDATAVTDDILATTDNVFENGAIRTASKTFKALADAKSKLENIKIIAKDEDGNGKINENKDDILGFVLTEQTRVAQIEKAYVDGKTKLDVFVLPSEDGEVDLDNVTVTGAVDSLEDIEVDDIVAEYKSNDGTVTKLVVSRETVEGAITRIDGANFYIEGTKYVRNAWVADAWELDDEGTFFLDHNNKIVAFEGISGPTSYAVVIGADDGTLKESRVGSNMSVDDYPVIKLATQDNERITYEVAVTVNSDGSIKSSAKLDKANLLDTTVTAGTPKTGTIDLDPSMPTVGDIVKYTIDANDRISKITTVTQPRISYTDVEKLTFASNAVVFDGRGGEDYAVANIGRLKDSTTGTNDKAVYNANGEIVVLLTDDVKVGTDTTYAYITKVNPVKHSSENVQYVEAYLNGEKVSYYTDGDETVDKDTYLDQVVEFELDGETIVDVKLGTGVVASTTASAVYAKANRIVLPGNTSYFLADDVTIVTIELDGDVVLSDLNDIEEGVSVLDVYVDGEGDVAFIVIYE